jgi:16S rRNA (guanine527-N7)-methyltransferase
MTAPTEPPAAASQLFGDQLPLVVRFAELLASDGVERGFIGPRETDRLWDRHLVNCAAVTELFPLGTRVVDVGSGAGLPGLVIALRRPDVRVDLVEPLLRRSVFLSEVVAELGLGDRVRVVRGRAEERAVRDLVGGAPWTTARAVAPLDRLVRWCLPLLAGGGTLAAFKGSTAEAEVAEHRLAVSRTGGGQPRIVHLTPVAEVESTTLVLVERLRASRDRTKGRP